ncbi:MAG TPA: UDP-N-acetylmuramate dehydrogenase [Chloroflexia bacterium]|nr:UDP-N-acetylmuramate dehydrogenase [Chloroflexia bacterium]
MVGAKYRVTEEDRAALQAALGEKLKENEPLAKHTSFRIGGPADFYLKVQDEEVMLTALKTCRERQIPVLVLGNGTNILISDKGWRGLVIENRLDNVTLTELGDGRALLKAGSGAVLGGVARKVAKAGWAGFEFASTIPGSVGGGVVNNAGAHGGDFSQVMTRVAVATSSGECKILLPEEMDLAYRDSRWREQVGMSKVPIGEPGNELILWAEFELHRGDPVEIKKHIDEMTDWRRAKQPQEPNAGSIFKNPPKPQPAAGFLIEQAELKGTQIGGAQISPKHANFIVNVGGAKAADVMDLIKLVKSEVQAQSGVELELEVELLGEWD